MRTTAGLKVERLYALSALAAQSFLQPRKTKASTLAVPHSRGTLAVPHFWSVLGDNAALVRNSVHLASSSRLPQWSYPRLPTPTSPVTAHRRSAPASKQLRCSAPPDLTLPGVQVQRAGLHVSHQAGGQARPASTHAPALPDGPCSRSDTAEGRPGSGPGQIPLITSTLAASPAHRRLQGRTPTLLPGDPCAPPTCTCKALSGSRASGMRA